jgi:DNA-binding PadR family transcriptional regulator
MTAPAEKSTPVLVLEVLRDASEPMSARQIREAIDSDGDQADLSQRMSVAFSNLFNAGRIDKAREGTGFPRYWITDAGNEWLARQSGEADEAPAAEAQTDIFLHASDDKVRQDAAAALAKLKAEADARHASGEPHPDRLLMREAAILLIHAAGEQPMTHRARRVIEQLLERAA